MREQLAAYVDRQENSIITGLIGLLAAVRLFFAATFPVSGDAPWHLAAARYIATHGSVPLVAAEIGRQPFWAPPLFHISAAALYRVGGTLLMKLTPALFGIATLPVVYLLGRRLYGERAGRYAALVVALLPLPLYYSSVSYIGTTITFFTALSMLFYLRFLDDLSWRNGLLLAAALAGGLWTKYSGIVPFGIIFLHAAWKRRGQLKAVTAALVGGAVLGAPWYVRNFLLLGNPVWYFLFGGKYKSLSGGPSLLAALEPANYLSFFLGFWGIQGGNLSYIVQTAQGRPVLTALAVAWAVSILLLSASLLYSLREREGLLDLWLLGFGAMVIVYGVSHAGRLFHPALPALAIVAGRELERRDAWPVLPLLAVLAVGFTTQVGLSGHFLDQTLQQRNDAFYGEIEARAGGGTVLYGYPEMVAYHTGVPALDFRSASPVARQFDRPLSTYSAAEIHTRLRAVNISIVALDEWSVQTGDTARFRTLEEKMSGSPLFETVWQEADGDARIYRLTAR